MPWLLLKDLQILRRSPLVTGLLVVYPVLIAVLIGVALSAGPDEPRIAFLNEIPEEEQVDFGEGGEFDTLDAKRELCDRVECVDVSSRDEAVAKVEDGQVLGALIIPADLIDKLQSLRTLNPEQPVVEVLVNEEDPVKGQIVDDRLQALITEANLVISQQVSEQAAAYLDLVVEGGEFSFLGQTVEILGLDASARILDAISSDLGGGQRAEVQRVVRFAELARENLDVALPLLGAVAQPIEVDKQIVSGDSPSLDAFAISVAATVTLMFVTVLLVAGSLALEREENTFARLTRGLVGRTELLVSKLVLGIACSLVVTIVMLAGLELFVSLDWSRFPLWVPAIAVSGAGFAAFGAAIGAAAREVRASSLLAFMVSLPIAFLSLVPSGTVSATLFDVIEVVAALFPFEPALDAISGALDEAGPSVWPALVHLAVITLAYGALARLALRFV
ncbi:MAG TPA: ABC transporter permease [Solirubrobacterales bacterium]|jgi:ABC-2 type transport system permease protein|nr:ABC transporter permease [Solirubrobacterales bacterium]